MFRFISDLFFGMKTALRLGVTKSFRRSGAHHPHVQRYALTYIKTNPLLFVALRDSSSSDRKEVTCHEVL
jgi:hypothetical protein